ncbi:hypothetical protein AB990_00465 [Alkalihalobacillus pseudalcaliphilus]|nr:hypothetical protein AB990_00465 [Alkalihalobacillus pseudalcaliphilus]
MAGSRVVQEVIEQSPDLYEITIIGHESVPSYNRILLSSVLQGTKKLQDIELHPKQWYENNHIKVRLGERVTKLDVEQQRVVTDKGFSLDYDQLVLATGSSAIQLPILGSNLDNVLTFRTMADCYQLMSLSKQLKKAVVIGGGLLGLEAAKGLMHLGVEVTVIHLGERIMDRQLDEVASTMLMNDLQKQGMRFMLQKATSEILGEDRVRGLRFTDGSTIETDIVVMCAGVRPNVDIAKESGLKTNRAIIVDDHLLTSAQAIYALGECAEHRGIVYGLVQPLNEQAKVLAKVLTGNKQYLYRGTTISTKLKISGIDVFSAGMIEASDPLTSLTLTNEITNTYKRLIFNGNQLVGAILYGDTNHSAPLLDKIVNKETLSDSSKQDLLSRWESGDDVMNRMKNTDLVCQCNAVSKGAIIEAKLIHGAKTLEQIKTKTKASSSCGSCSVVVQKILQTDQINEDFVNRVNQPLCGCTVLTEEEIVAGIMKQKLKTWQQVRQAKHWLKKEGCPHCKEVITYYLALFNKAKVEEVSSELTVAKKQNGTYIVTPNYYGGVVTANQLSKLAEWLNQYHIPYVSIQNDRRLVLPEISEELSKRFQADFPLSEDSGRYKRVYALLYSQQLGGDTEKSLQLAVELDRNCADVLVPNSVRIGIFPIEDRFLQGDCDLRIEQTTLGWEISIQGNRGDFLLFYHMPTSANVLELVLALVHYYRMSARYGETLFNWCERLGMIHIREYVLEDDNRNELLSSFHLLNEDILAKLQKKGAYT